MKKAKRLPRGRNAGAGRKERRTFTLSPESVALLKDLRAARGGARRRSVSSTLDDLLRALDRQRKRESAEKAISEYYDELNESERIEANEWGQFSLTQFMDGSS